MQTFWCSITLRIMQNVTRLVHRTITASSPIGAAEVIERDYDNLSQVKIYRMKDNSKDDSPVVTINYEGVKNGQTDKRTPLALPAPKAAASDEVRTNEPEAVFKHWATAANPSIPLVKIKLKETQQ